MIPVGLYTCCGYVLANRSRALVITADESYAPLLSGILLFLLDLAVLSHRLIDAPISTLDTIIPFLQIVPVLHNSLLFRSYLISSLAPSLLILIAPGLPAYPDKFGFRDVQINARKWRNLGGAIFQWI